MQSLCESPLDGLRVASWNALADSLSDAFPNCDSQTLEWSHRGPRIVEQVARMVGAGFMVALQEGWELTSFFLLASPGFV